MAKKEERFKRNPEVKFFTEAEQTTQGTEITQKTQVTPKTEVKKIGRPIERPETYRFSLYLDGDLEGFIKHIAWKKKQSITQYLNELVREDMKAYLENGGSEEEWS